MAVSADVALALRSKGAGNSSAESSSTLIGLLSAMAEPNNNAAAQHALANCHPASTSQRSSADKVLHLCAMITWLVMTNDNC